MSDSGHFVSKMDEPLNPLCAALLPEPLFFVKADDPRPHIVGYCDSSPLVMLYDPGSTINLIQANVLQALEQKVGKVFERKSSSFPMKGAFGGPGESTQKVSLTVKIADKRKTDVFHIVPTLTSPCIMGVKLIKSLGLKYDPDTPEQILADDSYDVMLSHTIKIPPRSSVVAACHTGGKGRGEDIVVDEIDRGPCTVPPSLARAEETFNLPLYNLTLEEVIIPKNRQVARASPANRAVPIKEAIQKLRQAKVAAVTKGGKQGQHSPSHRQRRRRRRSWSTRI